MLTAAHPIHYPYNSLHAARQEQHVLLWTNITVPVKMRWMVQPLYCTANMFVLVQWTVQKPKFLPFPLTSYFQPGLYMFVLEIPRVQFLFLQSRHHFPDIPSPNHASLSYSIPSRLVQFLVILRSRLATICRCGLFAEDLFEVWSAESRVVQRLIAILPILEFLWHFSEEMTYLICSNTHGSLKPCMSASYLRP